MKKKRKISDSEKAMRLGRKLCEIGTKELRRIEKWDDGQKFYSLSKSQKEAWRAIGMYVLKMKRF